MRILISIPHSTLLSPQGHLSRLNGLLAAIADDQLAWLVPDTAPAADLEDFRRGRLDDSMFFYEELKAPLLGREIPYFADWSKAYRSRLDLAVSEFKPELCIFDFPWGLASFKGKSSIPSIYFSHGVEADFTSVTLQHLRLDFQPIRYLFRSLIESLEKRSCRLADAVFAMSELDASRLGALYGVTPAKVWHCPQPVKITRCTESITSLRRRHGLPELGTVAVFHGSWSHLPNRRAIMRIIDEIAPACGGKIHFVVAGPGVPEGRFKSGSSLGFVDDLDSLLGAADFAIVPILEGSGVRMKLFDYFRLGVPVVSTVKGAEGLSLLNNYELILTENACSAVTQSALHLAANRDLRRRLSENALRYLQLHHDPQMAASAIRAKLEEVAFSKHQRSKKLRLVGGANPVA